MTVAGVLEEWRDLAPSEQAQFQSALSQLFKDGLVWREDEGDRPTYNFLLRRESLVAGYLTMAGWELRHDERLKIFHLAHRAGAHRRKLSRDTTIWLLVLRLLYAEQLETDAVFLTRYPSTTVGQIIERYTNYFGSEAQRKRTKFEDAMRELRAARLIRPAEGRAVRATDTDLVIELLPVLEVVVPAASVAEVAGRIAGFAVRGQRPSPGPGDGAEGGSGTQPLPAEGPDESEVAADGG